MLLGGAFRKVNGVVRNAIVRPATDGSLDAGFLSDAEPASPLGDHYPEHPHVSVLASQSDGKIVVGGMFVRFDGAEHFNIVRLYNVTTHPPFSRVRRIWVRVIYHLSFAAGTYFGYYAYQVDPRFIYHFGLGYEYWFDAGDGSGSVYFYDLASGRYFYTSPTLPFPFLYDFDLKAFLYYFPDPHNAGRYNTNGVRYFYNFSTGQIVSK